MGFGKLFNKVQNGTQRLFNKVSQGTQSVFNKVVNPVVDFVKKDGSQVLGQVSKGLDQVGQVMGSLSTNPLLTATLGPQANLLAGAGSALGSSLSNLTKQKNYSGSANQVSQQILDGVRNTQANFNNSLEKKVPTPPQDATPAVQFH